MYSGKKTKRTKLCVGTVWMSQAAILTMDCSGGGWVDSQQRREIRVVDGTRQEVNVTNTSVRQTSSVDMKRQIQIL